MITGRQALNSIEEASAKVRADEMRLDAALRSASEEAARLRQERLKELRALAELKFGLIKSGELIHELDAAEQQVKDLLDRHKPRDKRGGNPAPGGRRSLAKGRSHCPRTGGSL